MFDTQQAQWAPKIIRQFPMWLYTKKENVHQGTFRPAGQTKVSQEKANMCTNLMFISSYRDVLCFTYITCDG